jgi:DNA-binding transcriptional LysR family regulator
MTTVQLQALATVVEHGGFGAASQVTGLARSSLHRAARQLERRLGITLFETTTFGVRPTREAERLARRVRLAFSELAQARAEVDALGGLDTGRTVIGAMPLARSCVVPAAALEFSASYPATRSRFSRVRTTSCSRTLRRGRATCWSVRCASRCPRPMSCSSTSSTIRSRSSYARDIRSTVVGHPLPASSRAIRGSSRVRDRHCGDSSSSCFRARAWRPPGVSIECNSLVAARELLLDSDFITLLSARQVRREIEAGMLVAMPHPDGRVTRPIGLTLRRDWRPTAAQQMLVEVLRRHATAA